MKFKGRGRCGRGGKWEKASSVVGDVGKKEYLFRQRIARLPTDLGAGELAH